MKSRFFKLFCAILICASLALSLVSCISAPKQDYFGNATIVISDNKETVEYTVPLHKLERDSGALGAVKYISREHGVKFTSTDGGETLGVMIKELGHLKESPADNKYIYIWTSVEADQDVSIYAQSTTHKGRALVSSGVGLSFMSIRDGSVILFGYYGER